MVGGFSEQMYAYFLGPEEGRERDREGESFRSAPGSYQPGLFLWGFPKLEVPFWGLYDKDHSIFGSILGSPYFGKLPF